MSLLTSLVSYWKMDESSGNALDAHGGNTLAETSGTITSAAGKVGTSREFVATDTEYFAHADNSDLSLGDIDCTIQVWVYLADKSANHCILSKWNAGSYEYILYYHQASDSFKFDMTRDGGFGTFNSCAASTFGSPSTNTWYLIHAGYDATANQQFICVNAGTVDTSGSATGPFDGTSAFEIGRNADTGGAEYWDGRIDEVGLWKKVLSASERSQLYNGGSGLAYPFYIPGEVFMQDPDGGSPYYMADPIPVSY